MTEKDDNNNKVGEAREIDKYGVSTYGDYLTWDDDQRYEIIEGKLYNLAPAPHRKHQKVSLEMIVQFYDYLKNKKCELYEAPFDVRLPEGDEADRDVKTVVQPDIVVICDREKLDKRGCRGAPDLIIEIMSESSEDRDKKVKKELYEKHGVKEYWIVDYSKKQVEVYLLDKNNKYGEPDIYTEKDKIPVTIFDGELEIEMERVFERLN